MNGMKQSKWMIGAVAVSAFFAAETVLAQCGGSKMASGYDKHGKDIVATAVDAGQFKTLAAALAAADLVEALQGDGPFTVFAPTDEAFAKLPSGTVESLLKPENKAQLQAILKYHVVSGKMKAKDVMGSGGAATLEGQRVDFVAKDGKVMVDGAQVVKADIKASNGVIHVIDSVIMPAGDNIVATAQSAKMFNTLLTAAKAAGLADVLGSGGPFTVFAPTDDAFANLPDGTVESLLQPENKEQLVRILKHHVVSGRVYSPDAVSAGKAETLAKTHLTIDQRGKKVMVGKARVVKADIDASNGVIHVVDAVILPGETNEQARAGY